MSRHKSAPGPKRPEYEPTNDLQRIAYFVEECGEVIAATGKTIRWGAHSYNPELPVSEREINCDWLRRELCDLSEAIKRLPFGAFTDLNDDDHHHPSGDVLANLVACCGRALQFAGATMNAMLDTRGSIVGGSLAAELPRLAQAIRFAHAVLSNNGIP